MERINGYIRIDEMLKAGGGRLKHIPKMLVNAKNAL